MDNESMSISSKIKYLSGISTIAALGLVIVSWAAPPDVPDFTEYEAGTERKQAFINYFLPLIEERNASILEAREQLIEWSEARDDIGWWDRFQLDDLVETYRIEDFDVNSDEHWATLLRRVDAIPISLALAQAANESGWGTSRFGRDGYNYFGQWCYTEGCGIVPGKRGKGEVHEVAAFNSPEDSVASYLRNLNSHKAYRPLRDIRARLRAAEKPITGIELARGLGKYSQRGDAYIEELHSIIRRNDLLQHDID